MTARRLSPREQEIVTMLRSGRSYKAIAGELELGLGTVRTYIERAYRKLGVASRYELPPLPQARKRAQTGALDSGVSGANV